MTETVTEIVKAEASGAELAEIIGRIENVLHEERIDHSFIALLAMAIMLVNPDLEVEQLQTVLDDASNFICTHTATASTTGLTPSSSEILN